MSEEHHDAAQQEREMREHEAEARERDADERSPDGDTSGSGEAPGREGEPAPPGNIQPGTNTGS